MPYCHRDVAILEELGFEFIKWRSSHGTGVFSKKPLTVILRMGSRQYRIGNSGWIDMGWSDDFLINGKKIRFIQQWTKEDIEALLS